MHRTSRADRTFELTPAAPNVAAVLCSRKLDLLRAIEERQLHRQNNVSIARPRGNVVSTNSYRKSTLKWAHSMHVERSLLPRFTLWPPAGLCGG
jgi:hypothetical protein